MPPTGLIHFDRARESLARRTHHGRAQFAHHRPGGPIAAQTQQSLQAQCADAMLLVGHEPESRKPIRQGNAAAVKDRSCGY